MVTGIKCRSLCWAHHHIQSEFHVLQTSLTKTWRCLGAIISLHASGYGHDRVQQGLIIIHILSIQEWWLWLGLSISLQFFRGRCWIRQGLRPKDWNEWSIRYIMSFNRFALTSIFEEGHDEFLDVRIFSWIITAWNHIRRGVRAYRYLDITWVVIPHRYRRR